MFAAFDIYEQRSYKRGFEEAYKRGFEEGIKLGINLLKSAIKELRAGVPYEQICSKYGQEIADTAKELVNEDVQKAPGE